MSTALPIGVLFDAFSSELRRLGAFDRTTTHEPKSAPGKGVFAAVMLDTVEALPAGSGLNVTSSRVTFLVRIMIDMLSEPQDDIDVELIENVDRIYAALNGNFDLGVSGVRNVDVMAMRTRTGYVDQDGKKYRVAMITVPVLVNDLWDQAE